MKDFCLLHIKSEVNSMPKCVYVIRRNKPRYNYQRRSMPDVDGFQFCRMIKQNISYSHIPVILLTAKRLLTIRSGDYMTVLMLMLPSLSIRNICWLLYSRLWWSRKNSRTLLNIPPRLKVSIRNIISALIPHLRELYSLMLVMDKVCLTVNSI